MIPPSNTYRTPEELAADPAFIRWVQTPTPATDAHWQRWTEADAGHPALEQQARRLVSLLQFQAFPLNPTVRQRLEAQLRQKLVEATGLETRAPSETLIRPFRQRTAPGWISPGWTAYAVAASVATILLVGGWFWRQHTVIPDWDYTTVYGQTRSIQLPDQSIVTLNANSRLRLAENWNNQTTREVWLDGEAFFAIRKKPGTKASQFTVHSGRVAVAVLGTTFDVRQRRGTTQVVLSTGRIRLDGLPMGTQLMTPGDRVVYHETGRSNQPNIERTRVNPANYLAWQQREWVLDNTPLSEIATMLNDQFGLTVTLATPALSNRRLSGRMSIESPDIFLENLSTILGVSVRRTATNQVLIQP